MRLLKGKKVTARVPPVVNEDGILTPYGDRELRRFLHAVADGDRPLARALYNRAVTTPGLDLLVDVMDDAITSASTREAFA